MKHSHSLRHDATQQQARDAIDTALQVYCRKFPEYQAQTTWVTQNRAQTSFRVKGMTLVAEVEILGDRLEMGMDVPLMFWPLRGVALRLIEAEIRKWLGRAKAGELRAPG